MSVDARPILITSRPCEVTPDENASANSGEEGRISSPITTVAGSLWSSRNFAKATPVEKANCFVSSLPTNPRMSYALKILGKFSDIDTTPVIIKKDYFYSNILKWDPELIDKGDDVTFWAFIVKDQYDIAIHRWDALTNDFPGIINGEIKEHLFEFDHNIKKQIPTTLLVWPYSSTKGWIKNTTFEI